MSKNKFITLNGDTPIHQICGVILKICSNYDYYLHSLTHENDFYIDFTDKYGHRRINNFINLHLLKYMENGKNSFSFIASYVKDINIIIDKLTECQKKLLFNSGFYSQNIFENRIKRILLNFEKRINLYDNKDKEKNNKKIDDFIYHIGTIENDEDNSAFTSLAILTLYTSQASIALRGAINRGASFNVSVSNLSWIKQYYNSISNTSVEFNVDNFNKVFNTLQLFKNDKQISSQYKMISVNKTKNRYNIYHIKFFGLNICSFNLDNYNFYRYGGCTPSHNYICNFLCDNEDLLIGLNNVMLKKNIKVF